MALSQLNDCFLGYENININNGKSLTGRYQYVENKQATSAWFTSTRGAGGSPESACSRYTAETISDKGDKMDN